MRYSYGFSDWRGMIGSTGGASGGIIPASMLEIDMLSEEEIDAPVDEPAQKDKKKK